MKFTAEEAQALVGQKVEINHASREMRVSRKTGEKVAVVRDNRRVYHVTGVSPHPTIEGTWHLQATPLLDFPDAESKRGRKVADSTPVRIHSNAIRSVAPYQPQRSAEQRTADRARLLEHIQANPGI